MRIRVIDQHHIAYGLLPYKRNQDVIKIYEFSGGDYCAAVVDGWNNLEYLPDNVPGRRVAEFVAQEFPKKFRESPESAQRVAEEIDEQVLAMYPAHASCVGAFLIYFKDSNSNIVVSVGNRAIGILLWRNHKWYKPKEIGDYTIEYPKYPSEESRFFGRGELKKDPMYLCVPDVLTVSLQTPILLLTDGIEDVFTIRDINALTVNPTKHAAKAIVETILQEVTRRGTQRDDISVAVRL